MSDFDPRKEQSGFKTYDDGGMPPNPFVIDGTKKQSKNSGVKEAIEWLDLAYDALKRDVDTAKIIFVIQAVAQARNILINGDKE